MTCVLCDATTTPPYYLTNSKCCQVGSYWNPTNNACELLTTIAATWPNCDRFSNAVCVVCKTGFNIDAAGKCCANEQYWGGSACIAIPIVGCNIYNTATQKCTTCATGMLSDSSMTFCCATYTFNTIATAPASTCSATISFIPNCSIYDRSKIGCSVCDTNYYASNGVCVDNGKYWDSATSLSKPILITNCKRFNTVSAQCLECNTGFYLNNNLCTSFTASFPNCQTYDGTKCTACSSGTLSNGQCCPTGQHYTGSACAAIPITNCQTYVTASSSCTQCNANNYLINNYCCPDTQMLSGTSCITGTTTNCRYYDTNSLCTLCNDNFMLVQFPNNVRMCYAIPAAENCASASVSRNATTGLDNFDCSKCTSQSTSFVLTLDNTNVQKYIASGLNIANCDSYNILSSTVLSTLTCRTCTGTNFPTSSNTCSARTNNANCALLNPYADNCLVCNANFYLNTLGVCTALPANCLAYDNLLGCVSCPQYYYPAADKTCQTFVPALSALSNVQGIINSCVSHTDCSATYFSGLSASLSNLFSCHKCTDNTKIPFLAAGIDSFTSGPNGIKEYALASNPMNTGSGGRVIECLAYTQTTFTNDATKWSAVANCGLGIIYTNSASPFDASNANTAAPNLSRVAVHCAACLPGFLPTYATNSGNPTSIVYQCTAIANCAAGSTMFNGCSACSSGFAFPYVVGTGISYSSCIAITDTNCYAAVAGSPAVCRLCKSGYSLNADNVCEILNSPYCTVNSFSLIPSISSTDSEIAMTLFPTSVGCSSCQANFTPIQIFTAQDVCIPSTYIASPVANSLFDPNCSMFGGTSSAPRCIVCKTNFVITATNRCLAGTGALTNCVLAASASQCTTCATGYAVANNACVQANIANCISYGVSSTASALCTSCANTYYLSASNTCVLGTIANCLRYNGATSCATCNQGFAVTILANSVVGCVPIETAPNCTSFSTNQIALNAVQCVSCASGSILQALPSASVQCLNITLIPNCMLYDNQPTFLASSLLCVQCNPTFYLSTTTNTCQPRSYNVTNCLTHSVTADLCLTCATGYFLSSDSLSCIAFPSGVPSCVIYTNTTYCSVCDQTTYLSNGKCLAINATTTVTNCASYSGPSTCASCVTGYLLVGTACSQMQATGCLTVSTVTACATCPSGFGLSTTSGITSCVQITLPANCNTTTSVSPFTCTKCLTGFYLDATTSVCATPTTTIANCEQYASSTTCSLCAPRYILSLDAKSCLLSSFTDMCYYYRQVNTVCNLCQGGYRLTANKTCEPISTTATTSGCLLQDPNTNLCFMCDRSSYMNSTLKCVSSQQASNGGSNNNGGSTTPNTTTGTSILQIITLLILLYIK